MNRLVHGMTMKMKLLQSITHAVIKVHHFHVVHFSCVLLHSSCVLYFHMYMRLRLYVRVGHLQYLCSCDLFAVCLCELLHVCLYKCVLHLCRVYFLLCSLCVFVLVTRFRGYMHEKQNERGQDRFVKRVPVAVVASTE
jgi:hypothetical protein